MEEGPRRQKGGKRSSSSSSGGGGSGSGPASKHEGMRQGERRPLKTSPPLSPPDFAVPQQLLADSYLEREVRFLGLVSHIAYDLDATNRTEVLRHIDRGKREESVSSAAGADHDAIFSLSIHNIKISCRDGNEELYVRLPIHKIGAACYIRDDDQHLLCIKFGDFALSREGTEDTQREMCKLVVLACDNRRAAEELCSLISQTFQLVYTDATMQFMDARLCEAAAGLSLDSTPRQPPPTPPLNSDQSVPSTPHMQRERGNIAFLSHSSQDLQQYSAGNGTESSKSLPSRRPSVAREGSEDIHEMLKEYVYRKLYKQLNNEELTTFASLVNRWQTSMPFAEFCNKVLELYGAHRKYLLLDMRPFIPEKERGNFESFLERVGLHGNSSWHELSNVPTTVYSPNLRRPPSAAATQGTPYTGAAATGEPLRHASLTDAADAPAVHTGTSSTLTDSSPFLPKTT